MIDLKAQYGECYRITLDESAEVLGQTREDRLWLYQIPAKYGHIHVHGRETLGVYVRTHHDGSNRLGRLLDIPGARLHQRGDKEATILIAPQYADWAAEIIQAKRRRRLSEEQKQKLLAIGAGHRFQAGAKVQIFELETTDEG